MKYQSLPLTQLETWSKLNGIEIHNLIVKSSIINNNSNNTKGDVEDKGGGLELTTDIILDSDGNEGLLLVIPNDLILSRERVHQVAKMDGKLRELISCFSTDDGDDNDHSGGQEGFIHKPRGIIMLFLLYQLTISSPDLHQKVQGVTNALTDYVKFLPKEILLPTFYTDSERELLEGTSLAEALDQKMTSLNLEFDMLREKTKKIEWCRRFWWGIDEQDDNNDNHYDFEDDEEENNKRTGYLTFYDWVLVDAMYRSRALELPLGIGDAMVPLLDMANHASDNRSTARFDVDDQGSTILKVKKDPGGGGGILHSGEEITIMYGCGGACEMIFSYGFLEEEATSAREIFLSLTIPNDDPLKMAKMMFSKEAPGVRIFINDAGEVHWESGLIWWACVNEEEGLNFQVARCVDGQKELKALWKGEEIKTDELQSKLMEDEFRDIFVLRAVVMIQERVESQGSRLANSEESFEFNRTNTQVRESVWKTIKKLRILELELLVEAYQTLDKKKTELMNRENVREYLDNVSGETPENSERVVNDQFL